MDVIDVDAHYGVAASAQQLVVGTDMAGSS